MLTAVLQLHCFELNASDVNTIFLTLANLALNTKYSTCNDFVSICMRYIF